MSVASDAFRSILLLGSSTMYKFLSPFLLLILFANGTKIVLLHCTAVVCVRCYGVVLISGRLRLPIKITKSSGVFLNVSSEYDGHSGVGKK